MTKVFVARPPAPVAPVTPPQKYHVPAEVRAKKAPDYWMQDSKVLSTDTGNGRGTYITDGGASFDFELNVLDTASKRPVRGVLVEAGLSRGFTDRLGRLILHLPRGRNKVVLEGAGYVESGSFTPEIVKFEPIILEVDLDSDSIYTVYSTGECVPGERRVLDNPGHSGNPSELQTWLSQNWWIIPLLGTGALAFYFYGKSKTPSH